MVHLACNQSSVENSHQSEKNNHGAEFEGQISDKEALKLLLQKSAIGPGVGRGGRLRRRSRRASRARVVDLAGVRSASRAELATHAPMNEPEAARVRGPFTGERHTRERCVMSKSAKIRNRTVMM